MLETVVQPIWMLVEGICIEMEQMELTRKEGTNKTSHMEPTLLQMAIQLPYLLFSQGISLTELLNQF